VELANYGCRLAKIVATKAAGMEILNARKSEQNNRGKMHKLSYITHEFAP
jgi:hypothetical protein